MNISFRSLVPLSIYQYKVWFPWLCEGFIATARFDRGLAFLAASQAMRGSVEAEHREETFGKIRFQTADLVLPGSYILIEWRYSDEDHGKPTPSVQAGKPAISG